MSLRNKLRYSLAYRLHDFWVDHYPKFLIDTIWEQQFGHRVDWRYPRDLNECIEWLICHSDLDVWAKLSDKVLVREYIKEKGYGDSLTKLYGTWEDARDIDFDLLPDKFVLKCNHDSGSVIIVDGKDSIDKDKVVTELNRHLKTKFGYRGCEPHYNKIKPLVMAEEWLPLNQNVDSSSQIDYKFWCFNGHVHNCFVCYNRNLKTHEAVFDNYDIEPWRPNRSALSNDRQQQHFITLPPPINLDRMLKMASDLSVGIPEVRVDLYNIKGRIFFGELTFTSAEGRMGYFSDDYLCELGKQVDLSLAK